MSMNPHDRNNCPICEEEISGRTLISNRIKQREEFHCPGCKSALTYSVIKQYPGTKLLLHHMGDSKKLYGDDAQDMAEGDEIKPITLRKTIEVISAKAYLTKEMETRSGKILPEGSPVTILNVNMKGSRTEVVFEGPGLSELPTVSMPKANLMLSGEEIDQDLALRLSSVLTIVPPEQRDTPVHNVEAQ